jgi:hypothetical protein
MRGRSSSVSTIGFQQTPLSVSATLAKSPAAAGLAGRTAFFGHLDLDDLGTPVRELSNACGAGANAGEIKHGDIIEGGGQ